MMKIKVFNKFVSLGNTVYLYIHSSAAGICAVEHYFIQHYYPEKNQLRACEIKGEQKYMKPKFLENITKK